MKVSIVLPNLNGAGWLEGSLESLWAQTLTDIEIIVVDNGSTDASLDTARSYVGQENYTLIELGENTGFSRAVNTGIRAAKGTYVLLFNNDAFARPDMVEKLVAFIETKPGAFGIQPLMLRHWDQTKADDAGDYMTLFGWAMKRGDGFPAAWYENKTRRVFSPCGGATLYRRAVFDEIGLFEENFFAYYEDVDIAWRANNLGYKSYIYPQAVCSHIAGATTGGMQGARYNDFKSIQSGRNSLLLPYKNMPILMLILNLPFVGGGYLLKTLVFHLRGYGPAWRKGMKEGFALIGKLEKPPFRLKNLPNYFWAECSMIAGCWHFITYRLGRFKYK